MGKFCTHCGAELKENENVCHNCGTHINNTYENTQRQYFNIEDNGNIGWGVLGFFIPLAGLILYLVWKDSSPRNSAMAGKGALIGFIVSIVASVLSTILFVVLTLLGTAAVFSEGFYGIVTGIII